MTLTQDQVLHIDLTQDHKVLHIVVTQDHTAFIWS